MKQRVQSVNLSKNISRIQNQNKGRIIYPIKGDSNPFGGVGFGRRHYFNRIDPIIITSHQDTQTHLDNLTKGDLLLNSPENRDAKSLDYLQHKKLPNQILQSKLSKSRVVDLMINPQQIRLQPKKTIQKFKKEVPYDIQIDSHSNIKYSKNKETLIPIINKIHASEEFIKRNNIENRYKTENKQIDTEKLIEYAQRQYFKVLHKPQKLILPNLDIQLTSPKKGDFISEYHHSFKSKKSLQEKQTELNLCNDSMRKQLRRINPTFTSSLKNPLSDLNFQIRLLSQNQ